MGNMIVTLLVSFYFLGNSTAQPLKIMKATAQSQVTVPGYEESGMVRRRAPYPTNIPGGTNFHITLHCNNFNLTVLDSLYLYNTKSKLIINGDFTLDSLSNTYSISAHSPLNTDGVNPGNSDIYDHSTQEVACIMYTYKGIKYRLFIKEFSTRPTIYIYLPSKSRHDKHHWAPC
jgi:hypothetical protein